jgi:hypothetical protein
VERIGYETLVSPVQLSADQVLDIRLETAKAPIPMDEIRVEGSRRCVVRPGEGMVLAAVWEEARKALANQDWTSRERVYPFRIVRYERHLDASERRVVSERREVRSLVAATAIRSRPAGNLMAEGFVQPLEGEGRNFEYFGPDAVVLLSDEFLDTHCLRLAVDEDPARGVGVSFEPVRNDGVPDIRGTLWLDPETSELRFLEYWYTWAPVPQARVATGRIDFESLPSGAWIIRSWWIRTPKLEVESMAGRGMMGSRALVVGFIEEGEEVTRVTAEGEEANIHPRGGLEGVVWDSIRRAPLANAIVYLSGTQYAAETDPSGRYVLEGIPEGVYTATFTHAGLDSLGFHPPGVEVTITAGEMTQATFALPPRASLLEAFCRESGWEGARAAVVGTVRRREGGEPVAGATVDLVWTEYRVLAGRDIQPVRQSIQAITDEEGRYRACGISPGSLVTAQATLLESEGIRVQFEVPAETIGVVDLVLESEPSAAGAG